MLSRETWKAKRAMAVAQAHRMATRQQHPIPPSIDHKDRVAAVKAAAAQPKTRRIKK
jgi:hypothetical protein